MKRIKSGTQFVILAAFLVAGCAKSVSTSIQDGKEFLNKGDVSSAVISFRNAVQSNAASLDARLGLADALERSGDLSGAEQQLRQALALGGSEDDLIPKIALLLLDRSDQAILVKDFSDTELTSPAADSELRGIVALAELALRHKEKAGEQLARAKETSPAVRMALAQQALLSGQPAQAFVEIDSIFKAGNVPWWVFRATSRLNAAIGDNAGALAAMKSAYSLAGWHQSVIGEYAELLIEAGHTAEAKPLLEKLRKIAPRYWRTIFVEALLLLEEGKQDDAYNLISKVLLVVPEHIPSLLTAAKLELDRGELSSADQHLRKVLFSTPYSVKALRLQFVLELKRKNLNAASAVLERALRIAPNDRGLLAALADLSWNRGERSKAITLLTRTANEQPLRADLFTRLAEMQFDDGKKIEASKSIEQAANLAASNPAQTEGIVRALVRFDMLGRAMEIAQKELQNRPKDPEPYLWKAVVLGSQGNEEAALNELSHALDLRHDFYPALAALAGTATNDSRLKGYEERLRRAVDAGTKDARIYFDLARRMRVTGAEPDKIGALLERSVVADPESVGLREAAIRHWLAWGKKDKALTLASGGESANPDNLDMKALAASTHEAAGNLEQAITKYGELSARFPDRVDWGMRRAELLVRAGNVPEAIQSLRKLISQRADEAAPYQMLAMLQVRQKQGNDALVTAGMLTDRPKLKSSGLLLQGDVLAQLEQDTKALKTYDEAAKAGATEAAKLRKIELQARTLGEGYAAAELRDWLTKHPDSIQGLALAIRVATAKGDYATAAKHLEAVDKLNPNNPVTLNDLAWAYAQLRKPAALAIAMRANQLAPENPQILDTLAEAQALADKKKEAIANLRFGLALAPQHSVLKVHLAELLVEEGNKKEASSLLEGVDLRALNKETAARLERAKSRL
jgi:putative PEP-CTERM system TPR-repeat lipoprotein